MDQDEFNAHTAKLISEKVLHLTDDPKYFHLNHFGEELKMEISFDNDGLFERFPRFIFRTEESCNSISNVEFQRDLLIKWAIKEYGNDYYVTLAHTDPNGTDNLTDVTHCYSWINGSYVIDILMANCTAGITYRKTLVK
jgi:hypothetical protein